MEKDGQFTTFTFHFLRLVNAKPPPFHIRFLSRRWYFRHCRLIDDITLDALFSICRHIGSRFFGHYNFQYNIGDCTFLSRVRDLYHASLHVMRDCILPHEARLFCHDVALTLVSCLLCLVERRIDDISIAIELSQVVILLDYASRQGIAEVFFCFFSYYFRLGKFINSFFFLFIYYRA